MIPLIPSMATGREAFIGFSDPKPSCPEISILRVFLFLRFSFPLIPNVEQLTLLSNMRRKKNKGKSKIIVEWSNGMEEGI